jgi:LL-diaminopimelate aminotransferase
VLWCSGADEVALETCSFSKYAGFTGVRLGWTVVPKKLRYADGSSVHADWNRMMTTCFNGASNIVQAGGLACLQVGSIVHRHRLSAYYSRHPVLRVAV